jgi:hypothetical protein
MRTRRGLLAALGTGIAVGAAGCSEEIGTDTSGATEATESATDRATEEPTEESGAPEENETPEPEPEPEYMDNVPVDGLEMYEERLENADTEFSTDEIVDVLEETGGDTKTQAETLLEHVFGENGYETGSREITRDTAHNLAKSWYTAVDQVQEQVDGPVTNLLFNVNTDAGDDTTVEAFPV